MSRNLLFILIVLLIFPSLIFGKDMLVRVYVDSYEELSPMNLKAIDYAGARLGEYYDIILTEMEYYSNLVPTGLPNEIIYPDLDYIPEVARGSYHSYAEVKTLMQNMASNYSSICKFDSIGQTYLGEQVYCVKISDNPGTEDPTEPDVLIMGLHHAREWAALEAPLFIADSLTKAYSTNSTIKAAVDSREIWVVPCVNVDGYNYDYPGEHWWRKNRQPYGGAIGTDPNRTYDGSCNRDKFGNWGVIPAGGGGSTTHYPSEEVFCGPYGADGNGNSAPCCKNIENFVKTHEFNFTESFHSHAEMVIWPWGYTSTNPPNNSAIVSYGNTTASMIHCVGSGYYEPSQSSGLYPTSGDSDGWIYGWYHYVNGTNCVSFTNEIGTAFYQPASDLDYICRENFKGIFYMIQQAEDIRNNLTAEVPPPAMTPMDTSTTGNYTVSWSPRNPSINNPTKWELHELTGFSSFTDNLESGTAYWTLDGFSLSTAKSHSASHSFFSGASNYMCSMATTVNPYPVKTGDSLTFWCWYYLEDDYDVATVEVSVNGLEWLQLDNSYTGSQQTWTRKSYSLEPWVGKSIFIRFRSMTDPMTLREGIYVDDISPVTDFSNEVTISSTITDTFYTLSGKPDDSYWYCVKGSNTAYGWGNFSTLEDIVVNNTAIAEERKGVKPFSLSISPNPFREKTVIRLTVNGSQFTDKNCQLQIYNATGRLVKSFSLPTAYSLLPTEITWDGMDNNGHRMPTGVYYLRGKSGDKTLNRKLILVR